MIKMINKITGTEMYVDESRVDEYRALGHRTAIPTTLVETARPGEIEKAVKAVKEKAEKAPVKPIVKKITKKKG